MLRRIDIVIFEDFFFRHRYFYQEADIYLDFIIRLLRSTQISKRNKYLTHFVLTENLVGDFDFPVSGLLLLTQRAQAWRAF